MSAVPSDPSSAAPAATGTAPPYRVRTPMYEGPLDLLLYLVRRSEVDVCDVPLAQITARFVEYLEILQLIDFDRVGEFVVVASTLLEMKSRQVLPVPEEEEAPPTDDTTADGPAAELVEQLLLYRRYREAARTLEARAALWQQRYPRLSSERPEAGRDHAADRIREVELWDLVSALARVLKRQAADEHSSIRYDDTPISVYIERVGERVRNEGRCSFTSFFAGEVERIRIVSTFLAILELVRHHEFRAEQPQEFGEIWILPPVAEAADDTDTAADSGAEVAEALAGEKTEAQPVAGNTSETTAEADSASTAATDDPPDAGEQPAAGESRRAA